MAAWNAYMASAWWWTAGAPAVALVATGLRMYLGQSAKNGREQNGS